MSATTDEIVSCILRLYRSLAFEPPSGQYTVLAAFVLSNTLSNATKIISLSTGSKCLPTARLPLRGDALHDSHAEILARRGAIRWSVEEAGRFAQTQTSDWIQHQSIGVGDGGIFALKDGVCVHLYISTVPCEDPSLCLPALTVNNESKKAETHRRAI
jgi:tRNA-specific adenosine deaminase 1